MITIDGQTGTITWNGYTVRPDTSEADFRAQLGERETPPLETGNEPTKQGFLKRLFSGKRQHQGEEAPHTYSLPRVMVDNIPATGRLIFKDAIPHCLEIVFEMPGVPEIERLRAYNRFMMAQFKFTHFLDKGQPLEYRHDWGSIRCLLTHRPKNSAASCEVFYNTPSQETPAEIRAILDAQKAYALLPESGPERWHFYQLLSEATALPPGEFLAVKVAGFSAYPEAVKRLGFLWKMWDCMEAALRQKNYPDALAAVSVLLVLEPEDHTLYAERAEIFQGLKDYNRAVEGYTEAIQYADRLPPGADPDHPRQRYSPDAKADYLRGRGFARSLKGDLEGAVADYTDSLQIRRDSSALRGRGVAYLDLLDFARALADFEAESSINPEDWSAIVNRGISRAFLGDLDGALADLQRADQMAPHTALILGNMAWILVRRTAYDDARRCADEAVELEPQFGFAYYPRGTARAALGDRAGARADFQIALERWDNIQKPLNAQAMREMSEFLAQESG